jgi:hypothetical protein
MAQSLKKLSEFMETENLWPCSQEPAIKLCPESNESSVHIPILVFTTILILFSHLLLDSRRGPFLKRFLPKNYVRTSVECELHACSSDPPRSDLSCAQSMALLRTQLTSPPPPVTSSPSVLLTTPLSVLMSTWN